MCMTEQKRKSGVRGAGLLRKLVNRQHVGNKNADKRLKMAYHCFRAETAEPASSKDTLSGQNAERLEVP